jgi:MATE family multidrug resistance protein
MKSQGTKHAPLHALEDDGHRSETHPLLASAKKDKTSDVSNAFEDDDALPWTDVKDIVRLGVPICIATASWVGMKLTDTSLLGHVSPEAMAAASLSDLWTMCTQVLISGRVLGVLTGSSIAAGNHTLAGVYLQVSLIVLSVFGFFVMVCWWCTGLLWKTLGTESEVANTAGFYATILSLSIPAQVGFGQVSQFFSSQRILHPEVTSSTIALALNLLLGIIFVLGIPIPKFDGFGFPACPIVTTCVLYAQLSVLVGYYCGVQKLHAPCWGGWDPSEWTWYGPVHTTWSTLLLYISPSLCLFTHNLFLFFRKRIEIFCQLYIPAALGTASDFWRVAVIGMVAARLGETEVSVFNSAYRLMWIVLIAISALGSAAGIKITLRLGRNQGKLARQAGIIGLGMAALVLIVLGFLVFWNIRALGRIFTNDPKFLELLEEVALPFTITLVLMNFSVALERLPYAMGRTREVFWYGFVASWVFQVPAVYILTFFWRDSLEGIYYGMAAGYFALAILYGWIVANSDWEHQARLAVERAEMPPQVFVGDEEEA